MSCCFDHAWHALSEGLKWMVNNPALRALEGGCSCPLRGRHLRLESTSTANTSLSSNVCCAARTVLQCLAESPKWRTFVDSQETYPLPALRRLLELQGPPIASLSSQKGLKFAPSIHASSVDRRSSLEDSYPVQIPKCEPHQCE